MASLSYRTKIDLGVSVVVMAIGGFFAYQVSLIETLSENLVGPKAFPYFLSVAMIVLGALVGVAALYFNFVRDNEGNDGDGGAEADAEDKFGFADSDKKRVIEVIAMGFVYIWLFHAFGYIIATFISLLLMLLVFRNKKLSTILILSVVGTAAYDYLFMNLMGLYDPPGEYFDLQRFMENPSLSELTRKLPF
jgi:hypothetical protein